MSRQSPTLNAAGLPGLVLALMLILCAAGLALTPAPALAQASEAAAPQAEAETTSQAAPQPPSQTAPPAEGGTSLQSLPETPASPVEVLLERAEQSQQTMRFLNRITSGNDLDDEALVGARVKYQAAVSEIIDVVRGIDAQSTTISERLTEIGPPPEDSSIVEPQNVVDARNRLNSEKTALAVTKTELEQLRSEAEARIAAIARVRQEAFTASLSKHTRLNRGLFGEAWELLGSEMAALRSLLTNWLNFLYVDKFWQTLGSTLISLGLAIFLSFNFRRFFGRHLNRNHYSPDYFTRVFNAYWATLLPSAATAIFLSATYLLFQQFDLFSQRVGDIIFALFFVIGGTVFAWNFCRAVFAPRAASWRLIVMTDRAASQMFWLAFALFTTYGLDYLFTTINRTFAGGLAVTVAQGVVASVVIGAILMAMAIIAPHPHLEVNGKAQDGSTYRVRSWPRWISVPLIIAGGVIIIAAISGYVGFARFMARQVVVTGTILALMIIGILAARELSREGVLAQTRAGRWMRANGYEQYRIEQISLAAGIAFIIFILAVGVPAILLQWGTQWQEILEVVHRAFTGIDVGNVRISLTGLLIGIGIFAFVLGLTRLLQRWLTNSVFPRSRVDVGVSDSIKAGIGYTGFALAALMAITSAGFDLSSLAIVAGALSLGIGFGLQNVVSNFVSGLILLVERPIKTGDWIEVGGANGIVKRISVRATEVETFQRQSIIVPNSELINAQVGNWTHKSKSGRIEITVGVEYGTDTRLVERILYEIAQDHPMVAKRPEPYVWFMDFGASSLDFQLRVHLTDIMNSLVAQTEIRFEIQRRFAEEGIQFPFPQQDVNLSMSEATLERLAPRPARAASGRAASTRPGARKTAKAPRKTAPD